MCLSQAYNETGEKKKILGAQERDIEGLDTDVPPHAKKEKSLVFAAEQRAEALEREVVETRAQLAVIEATHQALHEDNECVVCMVSQKQFAFVPCGHVCVCAECADLIGKSTRECPMCCTACTQIIKTFF